MFKYLNKLIKALCSLLLVSCIALLSVSSVGAQEQEGNKMMLDYCQSKPIPGKVRIANKNKHYCLTSKTKKGIERSSSLGIKGTIFKWVPAKIPVDAIAYGLIKVCGIPKKYQYFNDLCLGLQRGLGEYGNCGGWFYYNEEYFIADFLYMPKERHLVIMKKGFNNKTLSIEFDRDLSGSK